MAEEKVSAASGAKTAGENVLRAQAGGEELRAVGFGKIEVDIARRGLMTRWRHTEPLQRVGLIAGARFIEILGGVRELRGEFGDEFRSHFVAARADGGAERGKEIGRPAAEFEAHPAYGLFGDAGERALPTRMDGGDSAFLGIHEKDRNAIGRLHGEKQAWAIRYGGVAFARAGGGGGEKMNHVGMDLFELGEGEILGAECGLQEAAVFGDIFARVPFHETEIQNLPATELADAAGSRAESVDEPGKFAQGRELQDLHAAGTAQNPER